MKILLIGAGAIGSVITGFLTKAGKEIHSLGRDKHIQAIKKNGLIINGIWGKHKIKNLKVYSNIEELPSINFDIILLTVKAYDTEQAIRQIKNFVKKDTLVISLQNGLGNIETITRYIGKERTVGGRVIFGAEIIKEGVVKVTVCADNIKIGRITKRTSSKKLEAVAKIFTDSGIETEVTEEIEKYIWGKVLYNCALNGLGTILESSYGELLEKQETREIMEEIVREIFLITKKLGINLFWKEDKEYIKVLFNELIPITYEHYPSMLQDIKNGRKTEIDYLNGTIVKLAKKNGLKVPVNALITDLIKFKEKHRLLN